MRTSSKILGIIQSKNEWPVLALSISHALMHHVDEVCVLNHSSTDASLEGLRQLQKLWGNRLHLLSSYDERYFQEATSNALILFCQKLAPEWIYVFDADEFLLTEGSKPLREILAEIDSLHPIIRYQVENWIPTRDFDETDLNHYRKLRFRSVPSRHYSETNIKETQEGKITFYDVFFHSKVIFRNQPEFWLGGGAHRVKNATEPLIYEQVYDIAPDKLRAAHFPLISRKRIELKAEQGKRLVEDNFPVTYGWQSHMIYGLAKEGRLDWFWARHSIGGSKKSTSTIEPDYILDDGFVSAIEPTLQFLGDSEPPPINESGSGVILD